MDERLEGELEPAPVLSELPPMPEVARAAAEEALAELPPTSDTAPRPGPELERRRRRKKGGRSRTALLRENRELRERAREKGVELEPKEAPAPAPAEPSKQEPPVVRELPTPAPLPTTDPAIARQFADAFLRFVFRAIAAERGKHWELTDEDRKWTSHLGDGLAPFLPTLGAALPWLLGGMGMIGAIQSRVAEDKHLKGGAAYVGPRAV